MSSQLQKRLQLLATEDSLDLLRGIQRGIEKESLRIGKDGKLSQDPHPAGLGSALTHKSITTDYSEALLEFITAVCTGIDQSLQTLEQVHRFVYAQIGDELLWAASMPCQIAEQAGIIGVLGVEGGYSAGIFGSLAGGGSISVAAPRNWSIRTGAPSRSLASSALLM